MRSDIVDEEREGEDGARDRCEGRRRRTGSGGVEREWEVEGRRTRNVHVSAHSHLQAGWSFEGKRLVEVEGRRKMMMKSVRAGGRSGFFARFLVDSHPANL